jgi:hypothetical protein
MFELISMDFTGGEPDKRARTELTWNSQDTISSQTEPLSRSQQKPSSTSSNLSGTILFVGKNQSRWRLVEDWARLVTMLRVLQTS